MAESTNTEKRKAQNAGVHYKPFLIFLVAFASHKRGEHTRALLASCIAFAVFATALITDTSPIPTVEQIACWGFAIIAFVLAFLFLKKEKHAESLVIFFVATGMAICGLSSVQGLLKTGILTKVNDSLEDYSKKLETFQTEINQARQDFKTRITSARSEFKTEIDGARSDISKQRDDITNQFFKITALESQLAVAQSNIENQVKTNADLQLALTLAQSNLDVQQRTLTNIEFQVAHFYELKRMEDIDGSNTNKMQVTKHGDAYCIVFLLEHPAVKGSVSGWQNGVVGLQSSVYAVENKRNVCWAVFAKGQDKDDLKKSHYVFQYTIDEKETNHFSTISLTNDQLYLDNVAYASP